MVCQLSIRMYSRHVQASTGVGTQERRWRTLNVFLLLVHGERRIKGVAGGAWLLISDNPRYEKELIKPQDMKDVEILGRCEIRIGRVS